MGISSLGVGSGILTQDVIDQLRAADEAGRIRPVELNILAEKDKQESLKVVEAVMDNFIDSIKAVSENELFDERETELTGTSVAVTASANSDIQDFTLDVTQLATKQIESTAANAFADEDALVSGGAGEINLNIDGSDYTIAYDATTTLKELKNLINKTAGEKVDATLVNMGTNDTRLFISSADTGSDKNITITNLSGTAIDANITSMNDTQTGVNAKFTFNNGATVIERSSNQVDDLISGYKITLKEEGVTEVSVSQNRDNIMEKMDSFVQKYNDSITELNKLTKVSVDAEERGIFSSDSTMKGMNRTIQDMISSIGGGVGSLVDYGFSLDVDGQMSLDKDILNKQLDENSSNVEAFFTGGDFDNGDGTTTTIDGSFKEMTVIVEGYTKYDATLDQFKSNLSEGLSSLEEKKTTATQRLDNKYEILKKQFAAYDLMISQLNSASSMFAQMTTATSDAQNN